MKQSFAIRINRAFATLSHSSPKTLPVVNWACHYTNIANGRLNATDHKIFISARDESEAQKKFAVWANLVWHPLPNAYICNATRRVIPVTRNKVGLVEVLASLVLQ